MGRVYLFLLQIGIDSKKFRFRQHLPHEKAHYASDCWDAELFVSGGWLECVGLADRQSFDLTQHAKATASKGKTLNSSLQVSEELENPISKEVIKITPIAKVIAQTYRKDTGVISQALSEIPQEEAQNLFQQYQENENFTFTLKSFEITKQMVTIKKETVVERKRDFIPCVIEPSFGIGRIMTALLEHNFYIREKEARRVLALSPLVAPYKVIVLPLSTKLVEQQYIQQTTDSLRKANISFQVDSNSSSIGKRYARSDELGTPYGLTLDPTTNTDQTVTLRERDSMKQVRLSIQDAIKSILLMSSGIESWENIASRYPAFSSTSE